MKKLSILALFLALLLSACSGRTAYVVNVDVLSLFPITLNPIPNSGTNTYPILTTEAIPIPLPSNVLQAIDSASMTLGLSATIPSGASAMPSGTLQVCVASSSATDPCNDPTTAQYTLSFTQPGQISKTYDLTSVADLLPQGIKIAVNLTLSGNGSVQLDFTQLGLEVKAHPFKAIPTQL